MPITPRPLSARLGASFTVADALAQGHTTSRLRAHDLERPYHGVRRRMPAPAPPASESAHDADPLAADRAEHARVLSDAQAYFQVAPAHAFVAGRSAAALLMLPCPVAEELCVGVVAPQRAPRGRGIRGTKIAPQLVSTREIDGVRVASPASIWAMLGGELTHRELVILGDAIVRIPRNERGRPMPDAQHATIEQLRSAAMARGRRHRGRLLAALSDIRVGSGSAVETDFRLTCQDAGLPEPDLDVEIRTPDGALVGIADAAHPGYRTLVEIEGDHHRVSRRQWLRDLQKHAAYVRLGYEVIRLVSTQVRGPRPSAPQIIADALRRHGWPG